MFTRFILCFIISFAFASCSENDGKQIGEITHANLFLKSGNNTDFGDNKLSKYWYEGKAEISRYELSQNRYGDTHPGYAIMIFVTEDFLSDKQVKNDRYVNKNSVSVLKNNQIIKFPTGIYDYSIMNSIFTPVNNRSFRNTLKISSGSQEWCGQTYTQINFKNNEYLIQQNSYFEEEGDNQAESVNAILEDEIFNRIRINPIELPIGRHRLIPSLIVSRFLHREIKPASAILSNENYVEDEFTGNELKKYRIEYPEFNRILEIIYEGKTPHKIIAWKDTYPSRNDKEPRTTIARRTHERRSAYWKENKFEDIKLRKELGLD